MNQLGTIEAALHHGQHLLAIAPARAAKQAAELLAAVPGHPQALLLLGAARARLGDAEGAWAVLEPLARAQPRAAAVQAEFGSLLAGFGQTEAAIAALRRATTLKPDLPQAWRTLGDLLIFAGRGDEADAAYARHLRASVRDPDLMAAAIALCDADLPRAERLLRTHLKQAPNDVAAIRMLAEAATRLGRYEAAENLLARCLELAPKFAGARHHYAVVLYRQDRAAEAVPHLQTLLEADPFDPNTRNLLAAALAGIGDQDRAIALYAGLVETLPRQPRLWLSYGHALRTAGRHDDAVSAYRACLALAPTIGDAWWSLANLKTGTLRAADLASMRAALASATASDEDRFHLHYALGRALEEASEFAASFAHYAQGAKLRRAEISYDGAVVSAQIDATIALFTPAFLAARAGLGCADPAPIFIIGLPRSGSTLIEQMLASHPLVEGTMELPELPNLVREISGAYPACLAGIAPESLVGWGAKYLDRARIYRKTDRPFFIDKLPNNWLHVGLIHLIFPHAKIIDARRDAMATGFSAFKQHFARGQHYSYDLTELGRFYRDYLRLMDHIDVVLPGRVHRVQYEEMVENTEAELYRLLNYCALAFDPACLSFHQNRRPVRTASSEQVRRPIFREGLDQWRNYEPWLGPLRNALQSDVISSKPPSA